MSSSAAVVGYPLTGLLVGFLWIRLGGVFKEQRTFSGDYGTYKAWGTWVGRERDWAPDVTVVGAFWFALLFWPAVLVFMTVANIVRALAMLVMAITRVAENAYVPSPKKTPPVDVVLEAAKREVEEIAPDV